MSKRIIRLTAVQAKVNASRSTIYRWEADPESGFPQRILLGTNSVGWYEDEIEAWLASRPRASAAPKKAA